jgi:hypothetical protein
MPDMRHSPDDENVQALDRMADFALLPDHIKRLGERLQRENDALRAAATEVSEAWNAWMTDEEGEGQDRVEDAIGNLRATLTPENGD